MNKTLVGAAALAAALVIPTAVPHETPRTDVRRTSSNLNGRMTVTPKGVRAMVAMQQQTMNLEAGDTVMVTARGQVTTEEKFVVLVGNFLKVSTNPTNLDTRDGTLLERPMGANIDRSMHHMPFASSGAFTAPTTGTYTFSLVAYAASIHATRTSHLTTDYAAMTTTTIH